jgi:hypothetical protein
MIKNEKIKMKEFAFNFSSHFEKLNVLCAVFCQPPVARSQPPGPFAYFKLPVKTIFRHKLISNK